MRHVILPGAVIAISFVFFGCGEANAPSPPESIQASTAALSTAAVGGRHY